MRGGWRGVRREYDGKYERGGNWLVDDGSTKESRDKME